MVTGPRGVGKTTYLLSAIEKKIIYFSADNPLVSNHTLTEIAEAAFARGYQGLIIDEAHHAVDWAKHLKSLYDSHPRKLFWASDSSSLILRTGHADLSRRFPSVPIPLLSFREYLALKVKKTWPVFKLWPDSKTQVRPILDVINIMDEFRMHRETGMRPFFQEGLYSARLLATLEKSIFYDVPYILPQVHKSYIGLMKAVVAYLATSSRNVSRNLRQFSHLFNITNFPLVPPIRGADTAPR